MATEIAHQELWGTIPQVDASRARQTFREVIDRCAHRGDRLIISRNGRPVAALVPLYDLVRLLRRESQLDESSETRPGTSGKAEAQKFDAFVRESRTRRSRKPDREAGGRDLPAEQPREAQAISQEELRGLHDMAAEVALGAIANFVTEKVVERASEVLITEVKERLGPSYALGAREQREIKAQMIESVRASVMDDEWRSERVKDVVQAGEI